MANRRDILMARHFDRVFAHSAIEGGVTYRRNLPDGTLAFELSIAAVKGRSSFEASDENGFLTDVEVPDFLISAEELQDDDGNRIVPEKGDLIIEIGGDGLEYQYAVCPPSGSEPMWAWCDPGRLYRRVHTKLVSTQEVTP